MEVINGEEKFVSPDISPRVFKVLHKNAETLVGSALKSEDVIHYLSRTGLTATLEG